MANFLKIGNSPQNYETEKALNASGSFDVNSGEIVEVTVGTAAATSNTGFAQHKVADPQGAILINCPDVNAVGVNQIVTPNEINIKLTGNVYGIFTYLVF